MRPLYTLPPARLSTRPPTPAGVRLLVLGRDDFTRLLGPLQKLLESQAVGYDTPTAKINKACRGEWWRVCVCAVLCLCDEGAEHSQVGG